MKAWQGLVDSKIFCSYAAQGVSSDAELRKIAVCSLSVQHFLSRVARSFPPLKVGRKEWQYIMSLLRRVLAPLIAREIALHLRHGGLRASTVCPQYHARAYGSAQDEREEKDGKKIRARPRLDFSNTEEAFRSKKFSELLRHYLLYRSFSFNKLVDSSQKVCCQSSTPTHLYSHPTTHTCTHTQFQFLGFCPFVFPVD